MSMKNTENLRKIEKNNLLKTGDFAKLANINRDTLAFYIKKGLINPVYTGENKYKYFSPEQIQTVSLIKYLRRCLIPIESIRSILSDPAYRNLHQQIQQQKQYLREERDLLTEAREFIEEFRKEKEFLDLKEPEEPFIQYCRKQKVSVLPVRFCQSLNRIPDLRGFADYLNRLSRNMVYAAPVCVIPTDVRNCADFCDRAGECREPNGTEDMVDQDYLMTLEEGTYAMIIGRSCTERMDENLLCLKEMVASRGYEAAEKYFYLFVETSLLKIPESSGQRYLIKMKIRKTGLE